MPDETQGRIGNVTVQRLPATSPRPKKKLSHTVKATPSARVAGAFQPIAERKPIRGVRSLFGRRRHGKY